MSYCGWLNHFSTFLFGGYFHSVVKGLSVLLKMQTDPHPGLFHKICL